MTGIVKPITDKDRKRLRNWAHKERPLTVGSKAQTWDKTVLAYEKRLSATEEEIERLRNALEPFVSKRTGYDPLLDAPTSDACAVDMSVWFSITMGDLRAARNALQGKKDGD